MGGDQCSMDARWDDQWVIGKTSKSVQPNSKGMQNHLYLRNQVNMYTSARDEDQNGMVPSGKW